MTVARHEQLSPVVAAYLAGIIDGEGCVYVNKRLPTGRRITPGYGVKVVVTITSRVLVEWFRSEAHLTSVHGHQKEGNRKYQWMCTWNNSAAEWLLSEIRPYMVIKTKQADLGLELLAHLRTSKVRGGLGKTVDAKEIEYRDSVKREIAFLNRRGRKGSEHGDVH